MLDVPPPLQTLPVKRKKIGKTHRYLRATVVVCAFQDLIENDVLDVWNGIMLKHINSIKVAATRKPSTKFIVLGPRAQIHDPEKESLCQEIMSQYKTGFKGIGNIFIEDTFFKAGVKELEADERRKELFDIVLNCFVNEGTFMIQQNFECELEVPAPSKPDVPVLSAPKRLLAPSKSIISPVNSTKSHDRSNFFL